ncbi:cytochrome c oxidase subunit 1 [Micromonospora sp. MW-13]|uniref:aa3-type cytochrome oxidase subunit I n=1 Tax=unclassified Micromonospora TaxID=2617518 RepID=UPI000E43A18C|nr:MULTISPECIES: cytochrome c oxidase subunit I [unclassified Micromonospora]MCX4472812.1 cytochrome c oxidase subunit I [Micromonospora sp. NBC_01655]RGC69519.1 cytochrome c oxidase subunit 1 [Micromonospora sp. MW-13]
MPKRVTTEPGRDRGPAILAPARFGGYPGPLRPALPGAKLIKLLGTTDAKQIGLLYLITSFGFFLIGGVLALLLRAELARPRMQFLSPEQYNQAFTMHGTIMLLLFATPMVFAFGNYIVPLQIGAPDVAFPRLNAFAYWLYLFGGTLVVASYATPGGAADFGWTAYTPLSRAEHSPGVGGNMWIVGLVLSGLGTILGAVNLITTTLTLRAPGMTMFRMPIFTWNLLLTSVLVILVFPLLAAALLALAADRLLDAHVFDPATSGPMLWQHLFWFFGHPEVYIVALPFFGIITEIIPVFARKPIFGYTGLVLATIAITVLSMTVWAHHMFGTGQVLLPFFSILSYLIAVPTGVKFFNWIGTMWKGQLTFETPMLFAIGFLVTFLLGGLTGVLLASPPADFHVTDTYFVVAHFHYVLFGTIVFAAFGGVYFWFPKMTGRLLDERLGKIHFWTMFLGFHATFLVQHWLGNEGMPRRYADYLPGDGFTTLNMISTVGSFVLGASTLFFMYNVWKSWRYGAMVTVDDPWGFGNSLEWATTCPPPLRNFDRMPRIRSERPAFDFKYGHLVADLGRDLPQRATKPPQSFAEELHHERHVPESPAAEGAHGARRAADYQPAPQSGARPVDVPEPEEIRRPSFEHTDAPGEEPGPPEDERWRHPHGRGETPER